jgi:GNAT superfamily N-acetyltransferase
VTARDRIAARPAGEDDLDLLVAWNVELIADEGHPSAMTPHELRERFEKWIESGDYQVVVFDLASEPVAYAAYSENPSFVYLRHFFVRRDRRRLGIGRRCIGLLFAEVWPSDRRCLVDALSHNTPALAFWRALGYHDYCVTLERLPDSGERGTGGASFP